MDRVEYVREVQWVFLFSCVTGSSQQLRSLELTCASGVRRDSGGPFAFGTRDGGRPSLSPTGSSVETVMRTSRFPWFRPLRRVQ